MIPVCSSAGWAEAGWLCYDSPQNLASHAGCLAVPGAATGYYYCLAPAATWSQTHSQPWRCGYGGNVAKLGDCVAQKLCPLPTPSVALCRAGAPQPSPAQPSHTFLTHEKIFHISSSVDGVRCLYTLCTPLVPHCGQRERLCCAVLVRGCVAGPGRRNSCPAAAGCCCCTARAGPRLWAGPGGGLLVVRETARGEESVAMLGPQQQPGAKSETRE